MNNHYETELKTKLERDELTEDRSGRAPLDIIIDELAQLPPADETKQRYTRDVRRLVRRIIDMTPPLLGRLCYFIEAAEIPIDEIAEDLRRLLRSGLQSASDVEKKGELLRLLSNLGEKTLPIQLENETAVRNRFPWLWIDAMEQIDWPKAEKAITETLEREKSARPLLSRLPYLWDKHGPLKSLRKWLNVLGGREKQKLSDWIRRRHISIPSDDLPNTATSVGIDSAGRKFIVDAARSSFIPIRIAELPTYGASP